MNAEEIREVGYLSFVSIRTGMSTWDGQSYARASLVRHGRTVAEFDLERDPHLLMAWCTENDIPCIQVRDEAGRYSTSTYCLSNTERACLLYMQMYSQTWHPAGYGTGWAYEPQMSSNRLWTAVIIRSNSCD